MAIEKLYRPLFRIWRVKRRQWFLRVIQPQADETMLDVGGRPESWTAFPQPVARIDCENPESLQWDPAAYPHHCITVARGDGCALTHADGAYPILFSNSVIEHVGDFAKQRAFAEEARRVGQRLWIQTPAFGFPIEPHYLAPFVHWLPVGLRCYVVRWLTPWGWIEKHPKARAEAIIRETRLLKKRELIELFPDCEILVERFAGILPKSYIVVRRGVGKPSS